MSELSPQARMWDLLRGALATRTVAIVAELGVAEKLAGGPRAVAELADETRADSDTLHRLLRALASEGVFAEHEPGVFGNTEASELLRDAAWKEFAHLFGGIWYQAVGELGPTGEPTFPKLFGADFWEWLAAHPAERASFDRAMVQGTEHRVERLAAQSWRGDETVVDVGGGNGSLLTALLAREPGLRGVVFDLPETAIDEAALGERCTFVAGSFFERVPEGDAYVLSTVLHDWDDEPAAAILRTVRAAARADARLFLLEAVVPPGNERHGAKWLDLLLLALFAGRERDEAQWRTLLAETGWEPEHVDDGLITARCR